MKRLLASMLGLLLTVNVGLAGQVHGLVDSATGKEIPILFYDSVTTQMVTQAAWLYSPSNGVTNTYVVMGTSNLFAGVGSTGLITAAIADAGKFLRADGTWQPASGGGVDSNYFLNVVNHTNRGAVSVSDWGAGSVNLGGGTVSNGSGNFTTLSVSSLYAQVAYVTNLYVTNIWTTYTNLWVQGDVQVDGTITSSWYRGSGYYLFDLNGTNIINATIDDAKIKSAANWNSAYGWGNHATNGYATSNGAVAYASVAGSATNAQNSGYATNAGYASVAAMASNLVTTPTKVLYVDKNSTATITNGTALYPFRTIQSAVDYVANNAVWGQDWDIRISSGQYQENVTLQDSRLYSLYLKGVGVAGINPVSGNSITSTNNNGGLEKLYLINLEMTQPVVISGTNNCATMNTTWIYTCKFVGSASLSVNCVNNWSMDDCYFEAPIAVTNVGWFSIENGRSASGDFSMTCDSTLPASAAGSTGVSLIKAYYGTGNFILTKGGTAGGTLVAVGSRINGSSGTITVPAGWTMQMYATHCRGNVVNNGTLQLRTGFVEGTITGTGTLTSNQKMSQLVNDMSFATSNGAVAYASVAGSATNAQNSGYATNAGYASVAGSATNSQNSGYATNAGYAGVANVASNLTTAASNVFLQVSGTNGMTGNLNGGLQKATNFTQLVLAPGGIVYSVTDTNYLLLQGGQSTFGGMWLYGTNAPGAYAGSVLAMLGHTNGTFAVYDANSNAVLTVNKTGAGVAGNLTSGSHVPSGSNTVDLGSASLPWRDLYLDTNSVYMGGTKVFSYNPATTQLVTSIGMNMSQSYSQENILGNLYAGSYNGSSSYMDSGFTIPNFGKYTLTAWVNPTTLSDAIFGDDCDFWPDSFGFVGDGRLKLVVSEGNIVYSTNTATAGNWVFVAVSVLGDEGLFPITWCINDSIYTANAGAPADWVYSTSPLYIGKSMEHGLDKAFFNGKIDEACLWNRNLTTAEIQELYNSGKGQKVATNKTFSSTGTPMGNSLQLAYHCDEGSGGTFTDYSGNSRNGTLSGVSWVAGKSLADGYSSGTQAQPMVVGALSVSSNITPTASNAYSLGSQAYPFKDLWLATNSIYMGGAKVLSYDPATTSLVSSVPIVQVTTNNVTNATMTAVAAGSNASVAASTNGSTVTYTVSAGNSYSTNAGYASVAGSATNAQNSGYATNAGYASVAGSATNSQYASVANQATNANYASVAGQATNAQYASVAGSATNANSATSATFASIASVASNETVVTATAELTGFESPTAVSASYDSTNRQVTLSQSGGVVLWWRNQRINMGTPWISTAHATNTGKWYLACRTSTTPEWSQTIWNFDMAQFAYVQYTTSNIIGFKETHGLMQWQSHEEAHRTIGTYKQSGGLLTAGTYSIGNGTSNASNTPGFDAAIIADEDLAISINAWPENLYSLLYFTGTGTVNVTTNSTNLITVGTTYPLVNVYSNGSYTYTTTASTGRWLNCYAVMLPATADTLSQQYRALILQPQNQYTTLAAAQAEDFRSLYLGDFTSLAMEFVAVAKVTLATVSTNTTAGRIRIDAVSYLTGSAATQVSITPTAIPSAASIQTVTDNFTNHLSAADHNVQQALDTLNNLDSVKYAGVAGSATNAQNSGYATNAGYASVAGSATNASYAGVAGSATNTQFATVAATATNLTQRGATNGQLLAWDAGTSLWVATNAPTSSPGGAGKYTVILSTTSLNVNVSDVAKTFVMQPTASLTNFLPSVTFADVGTWYTFVKNGTNRLTIKAADADIIADSNPGARLYNSATNENYATVTLQLANGTNWVITGAHGTWTSTTD